MPRYKGRSKSQIRNLAQYRDLSDTEFEEVWTKELLDSQPSADFEQRIKDKLDEFEEDYDLSDLKINDRATLRGLIQAFITLEDYEQAIFKLRSDEVTQSSLYTIEKLSKIVSDLRSDISKLQDDLNIKRKARKNDREASVISEIEELKLKAKKFHEAKSAYIFCPKCNLLLSTWWLLYPHENNSITLTCHRKLENGEECGEKIKVTSKELYEAKLTNKEEIVPESLL